MSFAQDLDPRMETITQFLRRNKVYLWEPPHWENNTSNISEELVFLASQECRIVPEVTLCLLMKLQEHSVERRRDMDLYRNQHLITMKVKCNGTEHIIRLSEDETVSALYNHVAELLGTTPNLLKLIFKGKILSDHSLSLILAEIKNNSKIFAITVSPHLEAFLQQYCNNLQLEDDKSKVVKNAVAVSALDELEITNQFGVKINLPPKVRMQIISSLALHNKGRDEMEKGSAENALVFLLESENFFKQASEAGCEILEQLSNSAQLNLDIVWCFAEIGSLNHLEDAARRLSFAENSLEKAYGANLEKVTKVKGSAVNELTLFLRLKLLQGIVAFYGANYGSARRLFQNAEELIRKLTVDETKLLEIMALGYKAQEARLALRQTENNPDLAVLYLEEKRLRAHEENARWRKEKTENAFKGIDKRLYERLISDVGVTPASARRSLLVHKSDYNAAVQYAMDLDCESHRRKNSKSKNKQSAAPSAGASKSTEDAVDHLKTLSELGIESEYSKVLLDVFNNDIDAIENYIVSGRSGDGEVDSKIERMISSLQKLTKKDVEDYLDSTLEKEMQCLDIYTTRLMQIESTE